MISRSGRSGSGKAGREVTLELLEQLPVVKMSFTERGFDIVSSDHATSKPQRGSGIQ